MKPWALMFALCILSVCGYSQKLADRFSLKEKGYTGSIKSIRTYTLETDKMDAIRLDSIRVADATMKSFKLFNEKGLLIKVEYYSEAGIFETHYEYTNDDDLKSTERITPGSGIARKDVFIYNLSDSTIIQVLGQPEKKATTHMIIKKIHKFDGKGRNIQIDYIDSSEVSVRTTKLYYDEKDQLIRGENYKFMNITDSFSQTFDLDGNKTGVRSYRGNGELVTQTVFKLINEETKQMKFFDSENNLLEWQETVSRKDEFGNTIREYVYDLIGKITIVNIYEIEYYP